MIIGYYKLKPVKMLNIDSHDFLFSDILRIFDNFTSSGGKMHAFVDEFDECVDYSYDKLKRYMEDEN